MSGATEADRFARRIIAWHHHHGRKDLPWQRDPSPYRVWVSEIMLQQTQVAAVIPYFHSFMERFPDIASLAGAPLDAVLHLWTGLGYYARARNLHRAAQIIREEHAGELPDDIDALRRLPGIGRSTAGAILALALGRRHPILDGNVKRVLSRYHALKGWPGAPRVEAELWDLALGHMPQAQVAQYTQGMMDLGATLCTRTHPACGRCPVATDCAAYACGEQHLYPAPRPRKVLPVRRSKVIILKNAEGSVLLERRPPTGVWGGLWHFPECPPEADPHEWCAEHLRCEIGDAQTWPEFRHSFTHFHLDITPVHARLIGMRSAVMEGSERVWYNIHHPLPLGLTAPVQRLLRSQLLNLQGDGA
jgi:A/G-specific adenine glycosylase